MIKTTDLRFFSETPGEHRTRFHLDVRLLREIPDDEVHLLRSKHISREPEIDRLIEILRGEQYRTIKRLSFELPNADAVLCKPLDDADLLLALLHQEQKRRRQQDST